MGGTTEEEKPKILKRISENDESLYSFQVLIYVRLHS
jgi:hypothetical protein